MEFCSENLEQETTTEGITYQEGISESEEFTESRVTASVSTSESDLKGELQRRSQIPQNNKTHKNSETQDFNKQHTKHTSQLRRKPTSSRRVVVKKRNRGNKIKSFQMKFLPFVASLIPCWTLLPLQHPNHNKYHHSRLNSLYPKIPKNSPRPSRVFKKEL